MRIRWGIFFLAAAGFVPIILAAQEIDAEELRPLAITHLGAEVGFETLYQSETIDTHPEDGESIEQDFEQIIMKETVTLLSKGYVYHPNLLNFDVGLDLGLTEERERGEFSDDRTTDRIGYDVHLDIERREPYGVELFALKDQQVVPQKFANASIVDLSQYRLLWDTDNKVLPTSVQLSSTSIEETGVLGRTQDRKLITITSSNNVGDFSRTNMRYQFEDFSEEPFGFRTQSHDISISNTLLFDDKETKRLNTSLMYHTEKDDVQTDQLNAFTMFTWKHDKNLESFYNLRVSNSSVSSDEAGTIDTLTHNEVIGLRHKLYENLTTVVLLDNLSTDSDTFSEERYGGQVNFNYTRPIPIGRINADFGSSLRRTDQRSEGGVSAVIDEGHVLTVGFPIFLNNINVDLSSVLITDASGTLLVEGLDYELQTVGLQTRVVRLRDPVFPIVGDEILVDYLFTVEGDLLYDTTSVWAGASLELFKSFIISYNFINQTQDLVEGNPVASPLQNLTDHRVNLRYFRDNPSGWRYEISSSYDHRAATFSPLESYGVTAQVGHPLWKQNDLALSASQDNTKFLDTGDHTNVTTLQGTLTQKIINPANFLILSGIYRDVQGTVDERTDLQLSLRLETHIRLVSISLAVSHEQEDSPTQSRTDDSVFFKVTRTF